MKRREREKYKNRNNLHSRRIMCHSKRKTNFPRSQSKLLEEIESELSFSDSKYYSRSSRPDAPMELPRRLAENE